MNLTENPAVANNSVTIEAIRERLKQDFIAAARPSATTKFDLDQVMAIVKQGGVDRVVQVFP